MRRKKEHWIEAIFMIIFGFVFMEAMSSLVDPGILKIFIQTGVVLIVGGGIIALISLFDKFLKN